MGVGVGAGTAWWHMLVELDLGTPRRNGEGGSLEGAEISQ